MVFGIVIPLAILIRKQTRTISGTVIASSAVILGMWLERYTIVVPTLTNPRLPTAHMTYVPSLVEWAYLAACSAMFILLYMVFTKFFPIVSIWEVKEGREVAIQESIDRIRSYLPGIPTPEEHAAAQSAGKVG
jgi:molybdopterin-containing oxidoreductase family membrane subunit